MQFPEQGSQLRSGDQSQYESNVKGLYIVGALGGYPLIKQAMNQGYEVVEYILGAKVEPADEPLLKAKFQPMPGFRNVDEALQARADQRDAARRTSRRCSCASSCSIRTSARRRRAKSIFKRNDYTNTFFSIVDGEVQIVLDEKDPKARVTLRRGEFFGEMSLISGRRRSATVHRRRRIAC